MIKQLTPKIWFGDKPSVKEAKGKVLSIINVAHSIRKPYWDSVGRLPWEVWYFRLASPDRNSLNVEYMRALENILNAIHLADKFPLLCHCRAGGHRGPTAAFFAAWYLDGKERLDYWEDEARKLIPNWDKFPERRIYRQDILRYCKDESWEQ